MPVRHSPTATKTLTRLGTTMTPSVAPSKLSPRRSSSSDPMLTECAYTLSNLLSPSGMTSCVFAKSSRKLVDGDSTCATEATQVCTTVVPQRRRRAETAYSRALKARQWSRAKAGPRLVRLFNLFYSVSFSHLGIIDSGLILYALTLLPALLPFGFGLY
jgi:hypothetical protein